MSSDETQSEAPEVPTPDEGTPVSEHLEEIADERLRKWFRSQRHDLKAKRRTTTLKEVVMGAYLQGVLDGAEAQYREPQDLSQIIGDKS